MRDGGDWAEVRVKLVDNGDGTHSIAVPPELMTVLLGIKAATDKLAFDGGALKVKLI